MASPRRTLPIGEPPHPAMDYTRLRAEGLRLLERLAGEQWTDFNTHDPGITILEQLCYAITDLAYRCNYPMADLLAGPRGTGLPGPIEVLSCDPLTAADLARLALDCEGVENVLVDLTPEPALQCWYHSASRELRLRPPGDSPEAEPMAPRGLVCVWLQIDSSNLPRGQTLETIRTTVRDNLHKRRALGTDLEVAVLVDNPVAVTADVEVSDSQDPTGILAEILEGLENCLAPVARFAPLADALERGRSLDAIFEGPAPTHGVVESIPQFRRSIHASDLIRAMTAVPQVRLVRSVAPDRIPIKPGKVLRLDHQHSQLTLTRDGVRLASDIKEARELADKRRHARRPTGDDSTVLAPPAGRDRQIGRWHSILSQLPACYGLRPAGLPDSAPARRCAQARQLEAYLTIFDQLLVNQAAQLAGAPCLLSTGAKDGQTYFVRPVEDRLLDLYVRPGDGALPMSDEAYQKALLAATEKEDAAAVRQRRFLAHLLARYGEELRDPPPPLQAMLGQDPADRRRKLLADCPRLGGARGSGIDLRDLRSVSGLADRLRLKLGLPGLQLELVEHILLRPIAGDRNQVGPKEEGPIPLLTELTDPDPFSLRISCVCRAPHRSDLDAVLLGAIQGYLSEVLLAEIPAHLSVQQLWLEGESWQKFARAWGEFRARLREYRWPETSAEGRSPDPKLAQLRLRDARDRVVDLLGLGLTYPLRDLPVDQEIDEKTVTVTLAFSQPKVTYALCDSKDRPLQYANQEIRTEGTGEPLNLTAPRIDGKFPYRIRATKIEPPKKIEPLKVTPDRSVWLSDEVHDIEY